MAIRGKCRTPNSQSRRDQTCQGVFISLCVLLHAARGWHESGEIEKEGNSGCRDRAVCVEHHARASLRESLRRLQVFVQRPVVVCCFSV